MKTTEQGTNAEQAVTELLIQEGHEIIGRNWKTKVCEIDIVSKKSDIIYLTEVKYRRQPAQGDGFEYINRQKLRRMNFAAEVWKQHFGWAGDYQLQAAAVSGPACQEIEITEV